MFTKLFKFLEDNSLKKLIKTAGIVLMGNTSASLMNFVSFTIMANQLGPTVFALFVLTQTYTVIVNAIFNVQTWESMVKYGHAENSKSAFSNVVKINFLMDLIGALIAFSIALIFAKPSVEFFEWDPRITDLILLYSFTIPFSLTSFVIGVPRLFDKFSVVAKIQIFTAALKLILVLAVAHLEYSITHYVLVFLLAEALNSILLIIFSFKLLKTKGYGEWFKEKIKFYPQQLRFVWWTNLRSITRIPVQFSDMVIISMMMPLETVGIYKVYKEIGSLLGRVGEPVNQAIYPEYAKLIGSNDNQAAGKLAKKTFYLLFALSSVLTAVLILGADLIIGKLYGEEYLALLDVLYILLVLYGISLFTLPVNSLFIAAGFVKMGFYIVLFTNIFYLFNAFFFGKYYGIYGIVFAFAVQMFLNQGLKYLLLKRYRTGWKDQLR